MVKPKVFFQKVTGDDPNKVSKIAKELLEKIIKEEKIVLEKEIPLKIHPGQPGNITFIKQENYSEIIDYLLRKKIKTYYIETGMVIGPRSIESSHKEVAKKHGFTKIPFIVADGENGKDYVEVKIDSGKHFASCMIAKKLADKPQIIVLSHFKGHSYSGFGGTLKMLGIGFASRQGKMHIHSKDYTPSKKTIDWSERETQYFGSAFIERMAEYALAATKGKKHIYFNFALAITKNCDCDGEIMTPIYNDLGIFVSTDPVAVDKAAIDLLEKKEGKKPFEGQEIFEYAQKIGLGSKNYQLIDLNPL